MITASLLLYSNDYRVYKNRLVQFNENLFLSLLLLILIGATGVLDEEMRRIIVYASVGVGLLVFCEIIIGRLFQGYYKKRKVERNYIQNKREKLIMKKEISENAQFQDSIFDEADPLLGDAKATQDVVTMSY